MTSLIFMFTAVALVVLVIRLIIKIIRGRHVLPTIKIILIIVVVYGAGWVIFYSASKNMPVAFGTEVCFDDWCATVTQTETGAAAQKQFAQLHTDSNYIVVHIRMLNHARGIAQTPSNPRMHIFDNKGASWPYSAAAQKLLENTAGRQPGIGHRLELHQSLETLLMFAVPKNTTGLTVLIEEGPPITHLIFPEDKIVFSVK